MDKLLLFKTAKENLEIEKKNLRTINMRVAVISAKNHKRQRRKRQSVTAKREKSQTPKVLTAVLTLPNLTWPNLTYTNFGVSDFSRLAVTDWRLRRWHLWFLALSNAPYGEFKIEGCFIVEKPLIVTLLIFSNE